MKTCSVTALMLLLLAVPVLGGDDDKEQLGNTGYGKWENGPAALKESFPIAVWLQSPKNAKRYREAGINVFVGLWRGPSEEQLAELKDAGMFVICAQNEAGLKSSHSDIIIGWMHGDEPDNAQPSRNGGGYGPPILPSKIQEDYQRIKERDPSRPVLLNLGQGVAFDQYIGRGVRRNHPEDYPEYIKGCDIASFDIYPAVHDHADIAGKLEFVPEGVKRLRRWSNDEKIVWNCIECSRISNVETKPTAEQIKSEVWMSLIHGSRGLIYFVHQFKPNFREASLLEDAELLPAVTALNDQIQQLAPVLNSPTMNDLVTVITESPDVPVAVMGKSHNRLQYVFSVNMRNQPTRATFKLNGGQEAAEIIVIDENRTLASKDRVFEDAFAPYQVHLYQIGERKE